MKFLLFCVYAVGFLFSMVAADPGTVTFKNLVAGMTDLSSLSEYPDPPYLSARASSNDPTAPDDTVPMGFGNYDHGFYRDTLPEGYLMLDASGPGVITHIWSARANGDLVFYFDGDTTPSWTVPMTKLLDGTGPVPPPYSYVAAKGQNCYLPIPYSKHCRVFYSGSSPDIYYQIDYRTYSEDTELSTFDTGMIARHKDLLDSIGTILAEPVPSCSPETTEEVFSGTIEPGATVTAVELDGPAAITELVIHPAKELTAAFLRSCIIEISFDSTDYPQVRVPLGDFFCAVPRHKPYRMLPVMIAGDGSLICRWHMPYRENASIHFVNMGEQSGSCSLSIRTRPVEYTPNTMYFYARWRQDPNTAICRYLYWNIYMADPIRSHPMLHITGKGVHVGTFLQIWNEQSEWWGEGDDKITVDGEPEPSFLGTGTEDYFGYAWSTTTTFSQAYHSQPYSDGFGGYTANTRVHISDPQPFTKSYNFDLEIQTAFKPTTMDFGRTVFFYACGKATTDHDTLTDDDLYLRLNTPVGKPMVLAPRSSSGVSVRYDATRNQVVVTGSSGSRITATTMRIFNAEGRVVTTDTFINTLSTASLAPGLYIADVAADGFRRSIRFIIDR